MMMVMAMKIAIGEMDGPDGESLSRCGSVRSQILCYSIRPPRCADKNRIAPVISQRRR